MMMDGFLEIAPDEMERIARRISREEGIKLFQQFAENFNKRQERGGAPTRWTGAGGFEPWEEPKIRALAAAWFDF